MDAESKDEPNSVNTNDTSGLDNWRNKDIGVDDEDKERRANRRGQSVSRIFEWPELESLFVLNENLANPARAISWKIGIFIVALGTLSLCLAAVAPIFQSAHKMLGAGSAFLSILALAGAIFLSYFNKNRKNWLRSRLVAERLRQLQYQYVLSNLQLAIDCVNTNQERFWTEWHNRQRTAIGEFKAKYIDTESDPLDKIISDESSDECWLVKQTSKPTNLSEKEQFIFQSLLDELKVSRLDVQSEYVSLKIKKLSADPLSPEKLFFYFRTIFILVVLVSTFVAGVYILKLGPNATPAMWSVALASCAAATAAAIAVIQSGTGIDSDMERYQWYNAVVHRFSQRWLDTGSNSRKIDILSELEEVAYWELRTFLKVHSTAKFLLT